MKKGFFLVVALMSTMFLSACSDEKSNYVAPASNTSSTVVEMVDTTTAAISEPATLATIARITNPDEAYSIYLDNNNNDVERAAFAKWSELMKLKIARITNPDEAYSIYLDNNNNDVERAALAKYKQLGGK